MTENIRHHLRHHRRPVQEEGILIMIRQGKTDGMMIDRQEEIMMMTIMIPHRVGTNAAGCGQCRPHHRQEDRRRVNTVSGMIIEITIVTMI
jgi:hypothetical protein